MKQNDEVFEASRMLPDYNDTLLRFFRDDVGGILITDESGAFLYSDRRSDFVRTEKTNWAEACPAPREKQKAELWDLVCASSGKTFIVITSTILEENRIMQIHQLVDSSQYVEMLRYLNAYSKLLRTAKDHDELTGLFNKNKFIEMKESLFKKQNAIAIMNLDVNNLKEMNDQFGHDAGDKLLRKAAESLKKIEARNILPFRVGGDEFIVAAIHVSREEAEKILQKWKDGLAELNRKDDGIHCVLACGFIYAEKEFDLDAVLAQADQLMYENKKELKGKANG